MENFIDLLSLLSVIAIILVLVAGITVARAHIHYMRQARKAKTWDDIKELPTGYLDHPHIKEIFSDHLRKN